MSWIQGWRNTITYTVRLPVAKCTSARPMWNHFDKRVTEQSTVLLWDSRCWHYMALNRERERDVARSATLAACGGSEQRIASIFTAALQMGESLHTKDLMALDSPWCDTTVLSILPKTRSTVPFSSYIILFTLSVWYSTCSNTFCPDCLTQPLDVSHHWQFTDWDYFKRCSLIFVFRQLCHWWKKSTPSSHEVINVWTVLWCRTPTTQLYLAVMYHWCRSMASGSITGISAPLSLTSGSCGDPQRPPATGKHSQHAEENHQSLWECTTNVQSTNNNSIVY